MALVRWLFLATVFVGLSAGAAEEARPNQELVARLLAQAGTEPLAVLMAPDPRALPELVAKTALVRALRDPQYAQGRTELARRAAETVGAEVDQIWNDLRPHLTGPAALVLIHDEAAGKDAPPLRLSLLATVRDAQAADAIRMAWPQVPRDSDALLSVTALRTFTAEQLPAAPAPPAWAERLAKMAGALRAVVRPRAMQEALKKVHADGAGQAPEWLRAVRPLHLNEIERLEWELQPAAEFFLEDLRVVPAEGAGPFTRLLRGIRADPQAWDGLQGALPGGQDLVLLFQTNLAALGADLPTLWQALERLSRGDRWTRTRGDDEEALAPQRFKFITQFLSGTFGIVGRQGLSGEAQAVAVAAAPGRDVDLVRSTLADNLAVLGADFETQEQAPRIGNQPPLAASFRGRGFLPAPVLGLSNGWIWLCSNTASYQELVGAFAPQGTTLAADAKHAEALWPAEAGLATPPERSAVRLRLNLPKILPLAYTSWMLGEQGPQLLGWKVPGEILPSPGFLKRYLTPYQAEVRWEEDRLRVCARGPAPGGAFLPLTLVALAAVRLSEIEASRPEALRKQLDALTQPKAPEGPRP
jgi:hypothetical protein